jgi:hypothetical protein
MSLKSDSRYIIKTSLLFCALAAKFFLLGLFLPERGPLPNPSGGVNLYEILGHILWGFLQVQYFLVQDMW